MTWYINRGSGRAEGPFDDATILAAIRQGNLTDQSTICAHGTDNWLPLKEHAAFAAALPRRAAPGKRAIPWPLLSAVAGLLSAVLLGVLAWRIHASELAERARHSEQARLLDTVAQELKLQNAEPKWLDANQVHHNCYTDNTDVTCYFTNLTDVPLTTCTRGKLVQKEAQGVKLESIIMCTGKLMPSETKAVRAPWLGGFARDICNSKSYGSTVLDWSVCKFDTDAFDLPSARKMAQVAMAKQHP